MEQPPDNHNARPPRRLLTRIGAGALVVAGGLLAAWQLLEMREVEQGYTEHENITATVFWVGETANESNDFIHNRSSAWTRDWVAAYGGIDRPTDRCGYVPCDFTPQENPFYVALPFSDYDENGLKPAEELQVIPWYDGSTEPGESILKNRWVKVTYDDTTAYAQWEDVGPFRTDDADYVFGTDQPDESRAGIDVSPAVADYLGIDGRAEVSWQFIDENSVPKGEWRQIITDSGPQFTMITAE